MGTGRGQDGAQEFAARPLRQTVGTLAAPGLQLVAEHAGIDGLRGDGPAGEQGGDAENLDLSHALRDSIFFQAITSFSFSWPSARAPGTARPWSARAEAAGWR